MVLWKELVPIHGRQIPRMEIGTTTIIMATRAVPKSSICSQISLVKTETCCSILFSIRMEVCRLNRNFYSKKWRLGLRLTVRQFMQPGLGRSTVKGQQLPLRGILKRKITIRPKIFVLPPKTMCFMQPLLQNLLDK